MVTLKLKHPIMLRTASREYGLHYQWLRRAAMRGAIRAQQLEGWHWFLELQDVERLAAERRRQRGRR